MNTLTDTITVIGYVSEYSDLKGYGFADTDDIPQRADGVSVYFHVNAARKTCVDDTGTMVLSDESAGENIRVSKTGKRMRALLMEVKMTKKGWKAVRWGIRPGNTWVHDLIQDEITEHMVGQPFIDETVPMFRVFCGRVAMATLTPAALTIISQNGDITDYDLRGDVQHRLRSSQDHEIIFRNSDRKIVRKLSLTVAD